MGKWIKLTNNDGNTVCLKYVPGMDRFIDHGVDRTTWALPLLLSNLPSLSGGENTSTTRRIVEPSESSVRSYAAAISQPSNASLRSANNDRRFISLTNGLLGGDPAQSFTINQVYKELGNHSWENNGPSFNLVDAYLLVDIYLVQTTVFNNPIPGTPTTVITHSVVAVIQPPDRVYSIPIEDTAWRRPLTEALSFSIESFDEGYPILDSAYSQLETIFGPF